MACPRLYSRMDRLKDKSDPSAISSLNRFNCSRRFVFPLGSQMEGKWLKHDLYFSRRAWNFLSLGNSSYSNSVVDYKIATAFGFSHSRQFWLKSCWRRECACVFGGTPSVLELLPTQCSGHLVVPGVSPAPPARRASLSPLSHLPSSRKFETIQQLNCEADTRFTFFPLASLIMIHSI